MSTWNESQSANRSEREGGGAILEEIRGWRQGRAGGGGRELCRDPSEEGCLVLVEGVGRVFMWATVSFLG